MIRRLMTVAAALAAAALLLPATTVSAAVTASLESPTRDAVVRAPVEVRVRVQRALVDPEVQRVDVRLSPDGASAADGGRPAALRCLSGCGGQDSVWGGAVYQPATAAPFRSQPACNGRWYLQTSVNGGGFGAGVPFVASAPGSPATDVRVAIAGRTATVTWAGAPQPDVAGYRIERRADGGAWRDVATVEAGDGRYVDEGLYPATYDYRVVTLRPDGRTADGGAMSPCADRGDDLTTTSASARGRVTTPPPPSPSPSPSPTTGDPADATDDDRGTDGGDGDDGTAGSGGTPAGGTDADGSGAGDGTADDGAATPAGDASEDEASPAPRRTTRTRIAPPPSARSNRLDTTTRLPAGEEQPEVFYGEGEGFSDELDYGDVEGPTRSPQAAAPESFGGRSLGAVRVFTERILDPERILRPFAGGLVMLTFGLHLRRWMRESDG